VGRKEEASEGSLRNLSRREFMVIGDRLKLLREQKRLSQGDIEERTGLLRCYVSRVENNHTVPSVETLVKLARALEVPMYRLFYEDDKPPTLIKLPNRTGGDWGASGKNASTLRAFRLAMSKMSATDLKTFVFMARKMARANGR
jgi:transcriptional regulator with XRE-family HTH domain